MVEEKVCLEYNHRIFFTENLFNLNNKTFDEVFYNRNINKVIVFIDEGFYTHSTNIIDSITSFFNHKKNILNLVCNPIILQGGEPCKNNWNFVDKIWNEIQRNNICRHSYIISIGGGAFLDLTGFASSTAHRGIPLIRVPTTSLSQADGGVGVKNGVNYFGKKNWVGSFSVPFAVINDFSLLNSLPAKEFKDGIIEAIKVSLIMDKSFYYFIEENASNILKKNSVALRKTIETSAINHINHIISNGDPFEYGSSRPLDYGHWVAHKLEQISSFSFTHGQAVAIGISVDLMYSVYIGLLEERIAHQILNLIKKIGFDVYSDYLLEKENGEYIIFKGLEEFREHLGGELTITLISNIGKKIDVNEIKKEFVIKSFEFLKKFNI